MLATERYVEQAVIWPRSGRHILAQADDEGIIVYQAYRMFGDAVYFGSQLAGTTLTAAHWTALAWIRVNTPPNSKFLLLIGNTAEQLF